MNLIYTYLAPPLQIKIEHGRCSGPKQFFLQIIMQGLRSYIVGTNEATFIYVAVLQPS